MSNTHRWIDRGPYGRLLRKYRRWYGPGFPSGTPKWWRKLHMTRPARRENRALCHSVELGADPDRLVFPLGSRKPHEYYW
jgi:hypothetical protein